MKELKIETSTQKLYWDSDNEIVCGNLFGDQLTEELARENVDAQERVSDSLNLVAQFCHRISKAVPIESACLLIKEIERRR